MATCLFCVRSGPFTTIEHIVPESLGNDELVLEGEVCDSCQAYFGKEIEKFVLTKTPLAFWRVLLGIRTKKRRLPSIDLSNPPRAKGSITATHPAHDNFIGFSAHKDGSTSVDIDDPEIIHDILTGCRDNFRFVFTPKLLHMLGRFLLKIGVELMASTDPTLARTTQYEDARSHARFGSGEHLWPLFHFSAGNLKDFRYLEFDEEGVLEHVQCYQYDLIAVDEYRLLHFAMGTDHWVIALSHRYAEPQIGAAFPGKKLELVWYSDST